MSAVNVTGPAQLPLVSDCQNSGALLPTGSVDQLLPADSVD